MGMNDGCFMGMNDVLWLDFPGTEVLTILFFPRLPSDTKILLLYPTVPDLTFSEVHITRQHVNIFSNVIINLTRCVTKSFLVLNVCSNVYFPVNDILKIIQESFLDS